MALTSKAGTMPLDVSRAPGPECFEDVACYLCGSTDHAHFQTAQEDLTGKPGDFSFVKCDDCGLVYQQPRLTLEHIKSYYDDEYIAHRKTQAWGPLEPFFEWLMTKLDRDKDAIVSGSIELDSTSRVLDVGCGAGGYLMHVRKKYGARCVGVDFKELGDVIAGMGPHGRDVEFHCGTLSAVDLEPGRFDLITMWHFLEHDYDPLETLRTARELLAPGGVMVIEVPRLDSLSHALYQERWPGWQAPQHTVALDKKRFVEMLELAGLEVSEYMPYGAYPGYFYMYAGLAFKLLEGKGIDLGKAIYSYLAGQVLLAPVIAFERRLNLSMQTVACRARA